jgi:hypothetical protein
MNCLFLPKTILKASNFIFSISYMTNEIKPQTKAFKFLAFEHQIQKNKLKLPIQVFWSENGSYFFKR